uniref:Reverse transcriptase domain-containing protein n=1 Tax=Globodera rostochiensis TaxID=31243 RepID=A0A914HK56_GLORO
MTGKATGLRERTTGSVRVAEEDTLHRTVPIRLESNVVVAAKLATYNPFVRPVAPIFSPECSPMPSSPRSVWPPNWPLPRSFSSHKHQPSFAILQPTDDPPKLAEQMKTSFPSVFQPGLGHCTKTKAALHLKSQAKPVFCKARPVPHGVLEVVDKELDRLLEIGAIKPVDFSRWQLRYLRSGRKAVQ